MLLELLTKRNEIDLYWHTNLVYVYQVAFVYLETRRAHKLIYLRFYRDILITVLLHKDCPLYYGIATQGLLFLSRYCYTKITIFTTVLLHKGYHFYKLLTKRYFSPGASSSQI